MLSPYKGPRPAALCILKILLKNPATVPDLRRLTGMPTRRVKQQITWLKTGGAIRRKDFRPSYSKHGGMTAVYEPVIHPL